ncbi:MAG: hypothetical protein EP330_25405 [Deltaproteobacteria bacterium]|nr:MAG: hypothetical protein EP330_25405 [Deltaproteobacteria bacterium]
MILASLMGLAVAGQVTSGHQIAPIDAGTGVGIEQQVVMGTDGGTTVTTAVVRWARDDLHIAVGIPYGAYRTPAGRDASLGNLQVGGYYGVSEMVTVGLEVHANAGEGAWSWANSADELWPGAGARGVFHYRLETEASTLLFRSALGLASARAIDPFPATRLQFEATGAVDKALSDRAGLISEMSFRVWDTSPLDLAGLARFDVTDGVRARTGLVLPLGTWAGLSPADRPAGVREATWVFDVSAYF